MNAYFCKLCVFMLPSMLAVMIHLSVVWAQPANPIVLDVAWSPSGDMIATIDDSGTLNITLSDQTTPVFQFSRPAILLEGAVEWNPQGDRLAAGIGNRMYIWDVGSSWQLLYEYEVGLPSGFFTWGLVDNIPEGVQTITWSLDGRYIVVGTYSYETSVWDTQEAQLIFREGDLSGGGPGRVWLGNDGWMGDGATKLNAFSGEIVIPSVEDIQYRFGGSAEGGTTESRPDNTQIAWGNNTGFVLIYNLNTLRGINALEVTDSVPPAPRRGIADISWDGTWDFIAAASRDGEMYVVNLATSEVTTVLNVGGQLNAIDWNPQTNEILYAGVSESGQPILSMVDVSGIGGVPLPPPTCDTTIPTADVPALISAIMTANSAGSPQTICLEEGTYALTAVQHNADGPNGLPAISGDVTLLGLGSGAVIQRDSSAPQFRILRVTSAGRLVLEKITIRGGDPGGSHNGGGIRNLGTLELRNSSVEENVARDGAGWQQRGQSRGERGSKGRG